MKKFRRAMLWLGLVFIVILTFLSIYGAFLGSEKAKVFFNSLPLSVYWAIFGIILAISIPVFPRLIKQPGLFAMHAGCLLIIGGSMWGSQAGHEFQQKYLDSERIRTAQMFIVEGDSHELLLVSDDPINSSFKSIQLGNLGIQYSFGPQHINFTSAGKDVHQESIILGQEINVPNSDYSITPKRIIKNLKFETAKGNSQAIDQPGGGSTPALEVAVTDKEGKESIKILADTTIYNLPFKVRLKDFKIEHYPQGKLNIYDITDPKDSPLIHSDFARPGKVIDLGPVYGKITPKKIYSSFVIGQNNEPVNRPGEAVNPAVELLIEIPGEKPLTKPVFENYPTFCQFPVGDKILIVQYKRSISDYISDLEVVSEKGEVLAEKSIEVNKPLHYGGYHFYQSSFQDVGNGRYATILSVTSDSGLYCVFIGFFAMCGGILYHQWLRPIFKRKQPVAQEQQ